MGKQGYQPKGILLRNPPKGGTGVTSGECTECASLRRQLDHSKEEHEDVFREWMANHDLLNEIWTALGLTHADHEIIDKKTDYGCEGNEFEEWANMMLAKIKELKSCDSG